MVGAIFEQANSSLDNDFMLYHPDHQKLVKCIDTGSHNWLNFAMEEAAKVKWTKFVGGAVVAVEFLKGFE